MAAPVQTVKMVAVEEDACVAIGCSATKRQLFVTLKDNSTVVFQNVPGFRFDGFMAAPRKEAYYKTFIQNTFITKPAAAGEFTPPGS